MIRVLIADKYPVVRFGLKQVLRESSGIQVIGETASYAETLQKVQSTNCQLLVLSADLLGNLLDLLTDLKRVRPDMRILLFNIYSNIELGVRGLKGGASGYINIQSTVDELVRAVRWVAAGRKYICAEIAERLTSADEGQQEASHRLLSDREFQVMRLFGAGKTQTDAARILEKLDLQSSAEIVRYAIEHQVVYQ